MDEYAIAARFVHLVSVVVLMGTSWFRLYAGIAYLSGVEAGTRRAVDRWLWQVMRLAAIAALASAIALWDALAVSMSGDWSRILDIDTLKTVLFATQFGEIWIWRLVVAGVLVAILMARAPSRLDAVAAAGLSGILIATLAPAGHAAMHTEWPGLLHKLADGVHLLCAGLWLGGLVPLACVVYSVRNSPHRGEILSHVLSRFSHVGYGAVALVIVTGFVNGVFLISPGNLLVTDYGRVLVAKVCVVSLMVMLAAVNRGVLRPRLATSRRLTVERTIMALRASIIAELVLGFLVLALVCALGALPPAH